MSLDNNKKFIEYYPLVDSLRAISVVAVIVYHLDINFFDYHFFSGGYLGVDIFFFISGYLITELIYNEYTKTGKFNLLNFYNRRLRRIIPAIIFLLFFLLVIQYLFLLPDELIEMSKITISNLFFFSNFYFHYNHLFYWADNPGFNSLLHTWSLAIEEQYYLLFPIFFLVLIKFFNKFFFWIILGLITSTSFLLSNYLSIFHYNFSFYMMPSRIFEFLMGSIIVLKKDTINQLPINKYLFNQFTGLLIILLSFIFFNQNTLHPSALTLIPLVGCIIILLGKKIFFLNRFLTNSIIINIGLASYSLYLWHYPVIAFLNYFYIKKDFLFYLYFLIFLIPLSLISYYFVEKTFRNYKIIKFNKAIATIFLFYLLVLISSLTFIFLRGIPSRIPSFVLDSIEITPYKLTQNGNLCAGRKEDFCNFNNIANKNTVLFFGDSVSGRLAENIKDDILENNLNFIPSTYGGCNFYYNFNLVNKKDYRIRGCSATVQENRFNSIIKNPQSIVVLSGNFQRDFEESNFDNEEGGVVTVPYDLFFQYKDKIINNKEQRIDLLKKKFKENILDILEKGHFVILVYPIPESGWNVPRKIYHNYIFGDINEKISISDKVFKNRTKNTNEFFDSINHTRLFKVYPEQLFCNNLLEDRCTIYNDRIVYFADQVHPSVTGSKLINNLIIEKIKYINQNYLR